MRDVVLTLPWRYGTEGLRHLDPELKKLVPKFGEWLLFPPSNLLVKLLEVPVIVPDQPSNEFEVYVREWRSAHVRGGYRLVWQHERWELLPAHLD